MSAATETTQIDCPSSPMGRRTGETAELSRVVMQQIILFFLFLMIWWNLVKKKKACFSF